jgi:FtsH-binding integral membrane protein
MTSDVRKKSYFLFKKNQDKKPQDLELKNKDIDNQNDQNDQIENVENEEKSTKRSVFLFKKNKKNQAKDAKNQEKSKDDQIVKEESAIKKNDQVNKDGVDQRGISIKKKVKNALKIKKGTKNNKATTPKDQEHSMDDQHLDDHITKEQQKLTQNWQGYEQTNSACLYPKISHMQSEMEGLPSYEQAIQVASQVNFAPSAPPIEKNIMQKNAINNQASDNFLPQHQESANNLNKHTNSKKDNGIFYRSATLSDLSIPDQHTKGYSNKADNMHLKGVGLIFTGLNSELLYRDAKYDKINFLLLAKKNMHTGTHCTEKSNKYGSFDKYFSKELSRLQFRTYCKSTVIFICAFAAAEIIQKIGRNDPSAVCALSIVAGLLYVFAYSIHLSSLQSSVEKNQKHKGLNSAKSAVLMPVVLGFMIAPVYFRFNKSQIIAAMAATLCIFATCAVYSKTTDKDLGQFEHTAACAAISLIIASLINCLIFRSSILEVGISAVIIGLHAFWICSSSQQLGENAQNCSKDNESQLENFHSMEIANSLVGVTLELLNIKGQLDR